MFVSRCYYFDVVLNAFGWYLQPVVRREFRIRECRASSEEEERAFCCSVQLLNH